MRSNALFLGATSLTLGLVLAQQPTSDVPLPSAFDWTTITPSEDLEYHDCYDVFKCARLLVPLNYYNESDTRKAAIAIQKLPAAVPSTDPSFGGSILVNPGGPGEPGNTFIQGYGGFLQSVTDTPKKKHFEMIGFDPRGIGQSTPHASCFTNNALARPGIGFDYDGTFRMENGRSYLTYDLAQQQALSMACTVEDAKHPIMQYMDTQSVCNDLIHIIDAIEAERDSSASKRGLENHVRADNGGDKPRLNYIGFSYGTTLANYFVTLHPERAGKVIFDGVQDAMDYATGPGWLKDTQDMDEVVDMFLEQCYHQGQAKCALTRSSDRSARDTKNRFYDGLDNLYKSPIPYLDQYGNIGALSKDDLLLAVGTMAYSPISLYEPFSVIINATIYGNSAPLIAVLETTGVIIADQQYCETNGSTPPLTANNLDGFESLAAVLCLDGEPVTDKSVSYWSHYIQQQLRVSKIYGMSWSTLRFYCSYWPWEHLGGRFQGPFTTKPPSKHSPDRPRYPFLFLSSRYDPVTPLASARDMAKGHPHSGVVVQESTGHTALIAAPSNCTYEVVRNYFLDGTVPSKEKVCEANCGPWDAGCMAQVVPGNSTAVTKGEDKRSSTPLLTLEDKYPADFDWSKFKIRKRPMGIETPTRW